MLVEAILTSTHNLCFETKIRKNVYTCKLHFHHINVGSVEAFISYVSQVKALRVLESADVGFSYEHDMIKSADSRGDSCIP